MECRVSCVRVFADGLIEFLAVQLCIFADGTHQHQVHGRIC